MGYRLQAPLRDRIARQLFMGGLVCLGLTAPCAKAASGFVCRVNCPDLTAEGAAEVEARARAALITSELPVNEATLACDSQKVTATVTADQSSVQTAVPKTGTNLSDLLLDAFEDALSRLSAERLAQTGAPAEPGPDTTAGAAEARAPLPAAPKNLTPTPEPSVSSAPAPRSNRERRSLPRPARAAPRAVEVAFGAALEAWGGDAASGPVVGASYGTRTLALALRVQLLFPLRAGPAFRAVELGGALGLQWRPTWSEGARLLVGAGASLLSATVRSPYAARGVTRVGAGFVDLTLSRPLWFGPWAVVPEGGLRLFTAERRVTLDQDTQLKLPPPAPHVAVTISRRFE